MAGLSALSMLRKKGDAARFQKKRFGTRDRESLLQPTQGLNRIGNHRGLFFARLVTSPGKLSDIEGSCFPALPLRSKCVVGPRRTRMGRITRIRDSNGNGSPGSAQP